MNLETVKIEAGTFLMGSPKEEKNRYRDEGQVKVEITKPFEMMTTLVTQEQWLEVMESNPSDFTGKNHPVDGVSWNDLQIFIKKLNEKTGKNYRLPTEAEWEHAARGGTETAYFFGDDASALGDYAWYSKNSGDRTQEVKKKKPSPNGLYDIYGNLWEWVQDAYSSTLPGGKDPLNEDGSSRVLRGGGWYSIAWVLRSANRDRYYPGNGNYFVGFRLVRTL